MSAAFDMPTRLEAETATETDYGGRVGVWTEIARLWIALTPGLERATAAGDAPPLRIETATALARDDARVTRGHRLTVATEPPWTVIGVARADPAPGRMTLRLERAI